MFIRFCLCFGMGCTPSMLSEMSRSRKNSDIYTTNNSDNKEIIHQDSTKCNQILVNPYNTTTTVTATGDKFSDKKDSIVTVSATTGQHINTFNVIPTVRRSMTGSEYYYFFLNKNRFLRRTFIIYKDILALYIIYYTIMNLFTYDFVLKKV